MISNLKLIKLQYVPNNKTTKHDDESTLEAPSNIAPTKSLLTKHEQIQHIETLLSIMMNLCASNNI
jgi:hypothetical protein